MRYFARIAVLIAVGVTLAGCAKDMALLQTVKQVATAEVPANVVIPVANSFDVLKSFATSYGKYCIAQQMAPAICSADNRRKVIKFVRSGARARDQLEASVTNGVPAAASVYNVLVAAVQGLQGTPVATSQFGAQ